jgi:hypothetical protein
MSTEARRFCDHCRREIPESVKRYELRASLTLHNGETQKAETDSEVCGSMCLMATISDLIKAAEVATPMGVGNGEADCHSLSGMRIV